MVDGWRIERSFDVSFACEGDSDGRILRFCAVGCEKKAILAGILIFEVNSAPFRSIFAALISGGMLGIDSVQLFDGVWLDIIVVTDVVV